MPTITDDALVLDSRAYRDRDLLVTALTSNHGVQRGVFRRSRGGRTPRAAATQILSMVRCSLYHGPHAELANFKEIELETSSYPLASNICTASAASVVAEILLVFCPENEPAPRRFRLGAALLDSLLEGLDPDAAISYGQLWALRLGGLLPSLTTCATCGRGLDSGGRLSRDSAHLNCSGCSPSGKRLNATDIAFAQMMLRTPPSGISEKPSAALMGCFDSMVRYVAESRLRALDFHRRHATPDTP